MQMERICYPEIRRDETKFDEFHGVKIQNPYHWLEDPDSEETKEFVSKQNAITNKIIDECPVVDKFKSRLTELWDYPKYGCPFKRGSRYFYYHNTGLQNQYVLHVQSSLDAEPEVFLDPNSFCKDGLQAISGTAFSEDGEYLAYGVRNKGSDWTTIKFMKVSSKEPLTDVLENVKFSCMSWTHDHKGLFYNKYDKSDSKQDGTETDTNINQKLYYHVIGTEQAEDILVFEAPDNPKWMIHAEVSDDGNYILITVHEGCAPVNRLYICDFKANAYKISGILPHVKVVDNFEAEYEYITNTGSLFTFKTNLDGLRYKLINIDFSDFSKENWNVLVPEHEKDVLEWAACVDNDKLVLCYLHDVKSRLYLLHLETGDQIKEFDLDVGTVSGYSGRRDQTQMFFSFTSFLSPGIIYLCDFSEKPFSQKVFREIKVKGFDASMYETKQIFYKSKDGTDIPMFLIHKKGIDLNGSHPCFLYGYGGFSISITPSFSISRVMFVQNLGGIFAIANIRGGGEYGEQWHKDGCFDKKQNVFDDFISAAEYLIKEKYTCNDKLVIQGGSNGGLLVTACMNQRPDLYKCVVGHVSVTDMLKFHKYTIGHAWTTDFGCSDKEDDFKFLLKYSPLHTVRARDDCQYPSLMLFTADHDDRVVPLHSYKLISEIQHLLRNDPKQTNPLLIRIDTESGHGYGKPTAKCIEETSHEYGFIANMLNAEWNC